MYEYYTAQMFPTFKNLLIYIYKKEMWLHAKNVIQLTLSYITVAINTKHANKHDTPNYIPRLTFEYSKIL